MFKRCAGGNAAAV